MSKEIDSEEVYEDDTPELEQADALEDYDAVEDEKQAAKNTEESDKDTEDAQDEVSKKKKIRGIIAELCLYVAIIVVCGVFVPRYVIQRTIVDGKSMMNTLKDGENLLAEKVSYRFGEPKRFDVIVFYPYGRDNDAYYIKRLKQDLEFVVTHMKNVDIEELNANEVLLDSMLFRMIQISENAKKLSDEYKLHRGNVPWNAIYGLRNRIVHDYGNVDRKRHR